MRLPESVKSHMIWVDFRSRSDKCLIARTASMVHTAYAKPGCSSSSQMNLHSPVWTVREKALPCSEKHQRKSTCPHFYMWICNKASASLTIYIYPGLREEACLSVATSQVTPGVIKELKLQSVECFGAAVRRRGHGSCSVVCFHAETLHRTASAATAYSIILIHP